MIAEAPPASRAALCVSKPSWFAGDRRADAEWTMRYYADRGWLVATSATYRTHARPGSETRSGYYTIDPHSCLVEPDDRRRWTGDDVDHDVTVLCRGSGSDLPWRRLWGATSVWRSDDRPAETVALHDRPRSVIFACSFSSATRFGSSRAPDETMAVERQLRDTERAHALGLVPSPTPDTLQTGARLMPPTVADAGLVRRLGERLYALEGFGRIGYSIAPARAEALLRSIGA